MQNNAVWLQTTPNGVKVRVNFLPMNAAEHARMTRLFQNFEVDVIMSTTQGPLSVDLYFKDKNASEEAPAPAAPQLAPDWQKAAIARAKDARPSVDLTEMNALDAALKAEHAQDMKNNAALTPEQKAALGKPNPTDKPA